MKLVPKAKKRLLLLAAGLIFICSLGSGIYAYRRYAMHRELAGLKAEGISASVAGNHVRAVTELSKYLRRRADDPEALRYYAKSRIAAAPANDLQAAADVITVLKSMSQLSPLNIDEHRSLMHLYALVRNDSGVTQEADRLLSGSPNDSDALKAKSQALMRQRDWTAALESTRHWSQTVPLDLDAQSSYMSAMLQAGTGQDEVIGKAVALRRAHPDDPRFELLESLVLTQTGRQSEPPESAQNGAPADSRSAVDWAKTAAARKQPDPTCTRLLVEQLDRLGLFDDSLALLRRQIAVDADPFSRQTLARRLWAAELWPELAAFLSETVKINTNTDGESIFLYGVTMSRMHHADEVSRSTSLLEQRHDNPVAKAWLCILKQLTTGMDWSARQLEECYEVAVGYDPENPFFNYFFADALNRMGEGDLAAAHLSAASTRLVTWAAPPARLAELLLRQGRCEAALVWASRAQSRESHNGKNRDLSVARTLGRAWLACLLAGRTTDEAGLTNLVSVLQQVVPGDDQTLGIQISLMMRANNRAGAKDALAKAINNPAKLGPGVILNYAAISQTAVLDLENECFDRYERDYGLTSDLAYARAAILLSHGEGKKGLALLNAAREKALKSGGHEDKLAWQVVIARYLDASGESGAHDAWIAIADANAENLPLQEMALSARSTRSDRNFMDRTIERVRKLTGDGAFAWRLARARQLLEGSGSSAATRNDAENASRLLSAMIRVCPECIEARLLMATCQQKLQNLDGAIEQLHAATKLLPDSVDLAMKLANIFEERNDFAQAQQTVMPFTEGPLANPNALVTMGWLQEHGGDLNGAEQSYRHALKLRPDMVAAQNNLAMILANKGGDDNVREALSLANKAVGASPETASLFDTLAAVQGKARDYDAALASIAKAIALAGANPSFKLHRVELLVDAGRNDAARLALGQIEPLLTESASELNKDWDLTNRLRKIQNILTISAKTPKLP